MAGVISAIAPRRPLAMRRPRPSASVVEAFGEPDIIEPPRFDMDRTCFIPAAVVTMRTPASANAVVVPDHDHGGHERPNPPTIAPSSDAVPTMP
jgi:hypothetical protein